MTVSEQEAVMLVQRALVERPEEWRADGTGEPCPASIARLVVDVLVQANDGHARAKPGKWGLP